MFDGLRNNPLLKKALAAGEERMGKLVTTVLSNERVMAGVQSALSSAMNARSALEKGVRTAMQAVNLPTTEDVAELKKRLAELESLIDGLAARLDREGGPGAEDGEAPARATGPDDEGGKGAA
jgi:predicted aminopeptidase